MRGYILTDVFLSRVDDSVAAIDMLQNNCFSKIPYQSSYYTNDYINS